MAATSIAPFAGGLVQPLESGDTLGAVEFLRRYEAMPDVKKAELVEGTVYLDVLQTNLQDPSRAAFSFLP